MIKQSDENWKKDLNQSVTGQHPAEVHARAAYGIITAILLNAMTLNIIL